ncbi:PcfJ domain-containing protein [Diplocloster hominis]|uniref:PcfJ domain-containing protein n=1 Tax=Diplocloster hominis TaxID=3079010 RepID=UPI0031B9D286
MKRTAVLKNTPPCAAPKKSSNEVLAVSQVVEFDGKEILNIDLFYGGQLRGRYFADKEEKVHAAFADGKWYTCMINNVARVCKSLDTIKGDSYYYGNDWEFATKEDEQTALGYLGTCNVTSFEVSANQVKYERAYQRKCRRIEEMMEKIPCVPNEMEEWVQQDIFPGNYLFFKKGKERTDYHCTACGGHSWKKKGWKHGEMTTCPKCGASVKAYSRKQERTAKTPVILLQACGEEWVERQFRAVCTWKAGETKEIQLYEEGRAIIPKGKCWGKVWYGTETDADEFAQDWWDKNNLNKRFVSSYLYPGNLDEVLPYGNLQNSGLDLLAKQREKLNVNKFITTFHQRPWMEYLAKAGLGKMVADIVEKYGWWGNPEAICGHAESVKGLLQLDGNRTNRMKQINGGLNTLEWLQYEEEREQMGQKIKISQESLEYLNAKDVSKRDCEDILKELGSVNRMVNYMKKQHISHKTLAQTWRDYLRMARDEGMDTTDDIVRLPKDLKARHDQLVELINARRDAERLKKEKKKYQKLDERIRKNLPEVKRYFWEDDTYMIIPAGKCEELVTEGRTLHHCVGSSDQYMESMANGKSWILFLRKKENLQKAYYTIEINLKDDTILQYYSEFDRKPDQAIISKVLEKFKKNIKRQQALVRIQVAAIA